MPCFAIEPNTLFRPNLKHVADCEQNLPSTILNLPPFVKAFTNKTTSNQDDDEYDYNVYEDDAGDTSEGSDLGLT